MADIFGKDSVQVKTPITSDFCEITWDGGPVGAAIQFSLEYSQQVTRRRSIGNRDAIIYGSQPVGRATMARLITSAGPDTTGKSWECGTGEMSFELGACDGGGAQTFHAKGCIVSSFSIQASAEDLTVMDNVVIDFMELTRG